MRERGASVDLSGISATNESLMKNTRALSLADVTRALLLLHSRLLSLSLARDATLASLATQLTSFASSGIQRTR